VIGDNRPRLYWAQVAASAWARARARLPGLHRPRSFAYVWNHAEVSVIVAEDQEQVDKIVALSRVPASAS